MEKFSHDLAIALMEETSLHHQVRVNSWGRRRRTRSTGSLPCGPQPTEKEDSSSSRSDVRQLTNMDSLNITNVKFPISDSDEKEICLLSKFPLKSSHRLGILEPDSLYETFSPARFFKPASRKKRKLKRMVMDCNNGAVTPIQIKGTNASTTAADMGGRGNVRKRILNPDINNRNNVLFCGKRKRSNRDRDQDYDQTKYHSMSLPRFNNNEYTKTRHRSFTSTSKLNAGILLPLNKGLLSKIEKISRMQIIDNAQKLSITHILNDSHPLSAETGISQTNRDFKSLRKTRNIYRGTQLQELQFTVSYHPMNCGGLNSFSSSSSLSSSESDDAQTTNDTDREGDDELTDWPGNEYITGICDVKIDLKRKLIKKSNNFLTKTDESIVVDDDTIMLTSDDWSPNVFSEKLELRYRTSKPIQIVSRELNFESYACNKDDKDNLIPLKQIESEMSGETSNTFLSSSPSQSFEAREIHAGCRQKDDRPGFRVKTTINERLAGFLPDQ